MSCLLSRFDSPFKSKKIWLTNCKSEKLTSSLTSNTGWKTYCNIATMANLKCRPLTPVWWSMDQQHLRNDHRRNIGSLERILQQICQLLELDEPGSILVRTYTSFIRFFIRGLHFLTANYARHTLGLHGALRWVIISTKLIQEVAPQETLESLLLLVSAVPRMEQFVGDVCNIIFIEGQNWILSRYVPFTLFTILSSAQTIIYIAW